MDRGRRSGLGRDDRRWSLIKRGEVYWVKLDPTIGAEIRKTRPALIVSNDGNNLHAGTVTVLPLSSAVGKVYSFETLLRPDVCGHKEASKIKADQIRTVDKSRLGKLLGHVPEALMPRVETALRLHLAL